MPRTVDVVIDMGNPFLNHTVDAFLKIGAVAATKTVAEETYEIVKGGSVSNHNFEKSLKKMCKEGAYWGTVAGVYAGMQCGAERICGTRDWIYPSKNAPPPSNPSQASPLASPTPPATALPPSTPSTTPPPPPTPSTPLPNSIFQS